MPNGNTRKNGAIYAGENKGAKNTAQGWQGHGGMCGCGSCGGGWHSFYLLRVLITIIIILLVFMAGVRFGELKALVSGGRHGYMMKDSYSPPPMVDAVPVTDDTASPAPTPPPAPAP